MLCAERGFSPIRRPGGIPGIRFAPLGLGLEDDHGLQHGKRRRVGGSLGPARLAQHVRHFGKLPDHPVRELEHLLGLGDGDARHGGGHVEDGPFFQRRHEFRAQLEIDRNRDDHQGKSARDHHPFPAQGPERHGVVDPDQKAADGVFLFGVNRAHKKRVDHPGEPPRSETEILHAGEKEPQRRVQGDRQHGGDDHGQVLGIGQGLEEAAFLGLQGKDGQEGDGDHQQGKEAGAGHLLDGPDDHGAIIFPPALLIPTAPGSCGSVRPPRWRRPPWPRWRWRSPPGT